MDGLIAFVLSKQYTNSVALNGVPINYPKINPSTLHWEIYNPSIPGYVDSGVLAEGKDGRNIEISIDTAHIRWRFIGDATWINLIALMDLKGADGVTPHIDSTTGNWFIGTVNTGVKAEGAPGQPGISPHIDSTTGNWFIGTIDTNIKAQGIQGNKGLPGVSPHIDSTSGNWFIGSVDTGVKASGESGSNGISPRIDSMTGNWFIGSVDTGVKAQGEKGLPGEAAVANIAYRGIWEPGTYLKNDCTISLIDGHSYVCTAEDTTEEPGPSALDWGLWVQKGPKGDKGDNGTNPHIDSITGNWFVGVTDTGVKAEGLDGISPHIDSVTGNWCIGPVNTGIKAQGAKGNDGDPGETPEFRMNDDTLQYRFTTATPTIWTNLYTFTGGDGGNGYEPPFGGIPRDDLTQDVQDALDSADSALQPSDLGSHNTDSSAHTDIRSDIDKKINKVPAAQKDNFATYDTNGQIKDSGISKTDIQIKDEALVTFARKEDSISFRGNIDTSVNINELGSPYRTESGWWRVNSIVVEEGCGWPAELVGVGIVGTLTVLSTNESGVCGTRKLSLYDDGGVWEQYITTDGGFGVWKRIDKSISSDNTFTVIPDIDNIESINRLPSTGVSWKVLETGYVQLGCFYVSNAPQTLTLYRNEKPYLTINISVFFNWRHDPIQVAKDDVIRIEGTNIQNTYCYFIPPKIIWALTPATKFNVNLIGPPDYKNMDTVNHINTNGGEWVVKDNGYVYVEFLMKSTSSVGNDSNVYIDDKQIGLARGYGEDMGDGSYSDVHQVAKDQVIKIWGNANSGIYRIYCYFIPPISVSPMFVTEANLQTGNQPGDMKIDPNTKVPSLIGWEDTVIKKSSLPSDSDSVYSSFAEWIVSVSFGQFIVGSGTTLSWADLPVLCSELSQFSTRMWTISIYWGGGGQKIVQVLTNKCIYQRSIDVISGVWLESWIKLVSVINYSLEEQNTGIKWLHGEDIYQKTLEITLPSISVGGMEIVGLISSLLPGVTRLIRSENVSVIGVTDTFSVFLSENNVGFFNNYSVPIAAGTEIIITLWYIK